MSLEPKVPSPGPSSTTGHTGEEEKKVSGYNVGVYGAQGAGGVTADDDFYDPSKESFMTRLGFTAESFKRAPGSTRGLVAHGDIPPEYLQHDNPLLQQKMKPRHLQMIAVGESPRLPDRSDRRGCPCLRRRHDNMLTSGGSIGTGLFVGSGSALSDGGPAAVLLAWIIMGECSGHMTDGQRLNPQVSC